MLKRNLMVAVAATLIFFPEFAHADTENQQTDCRKILDSAQRLQCYDQLALSSEKKLPTISATAPISAEAVIPTSTAPVAKALSSVEASAATSTPKEKAVYTADAIEEDFGRSQARPSDAVDELQAKVKSVSNNNYRKLIITLENGHVWRQSDSDAIQLKAGDTVVIEKASFGSFLLNREGSNRKIRVKRVE